MDVGNGAHRVAKTRHIGTAGVSEAALHEDRRTTRHGNIIVNDCECGGAFPTRGSGGGLHHGRRFRARG